MKARLNITEQERLRYSYRRLRAISALRNAGVEPRCGMDKTYRAPESGRLGYRVELFDGSDWHCERLTDVETLAAEFTLWQRARRQGYTIPIGFPAWQADPMQRRLLLRAGLWDEHNPAPVYNATQVPMTIEQCSWERCPYPADGVIEGRAMCAGHAMVYGQMRLANDPPRVGRR